MLHWWRDYYTAKHAEPMPCSMYGHDNEPKARDLYSKYLHKFHHQQASVERIGFHIDYQVCTVYQVLVLTLSIILV